MNETGIFPRRVFTPGTLAASVQLMPSPPGATRDFARSLDRIADGLTQVEAAMRAQLASESTVVMEMGEYVLSSGGKRIRPALLFFASELCGYAGPRRVQIAAGIEFLHTATLLHDDVVDSGDLRRGKAAANVLWGNRRAVLVGDFFYARASSMIVEDGEVALFEIFANTIRRMAEGEILQMQRSFDPEVSQAQYYGVIDRKSAALMSASCEAGAILGSVTRAERRRLAEFGRELGLAFQLRDDALDYAASEGDLGKRPHTDLREGKVTLPLLLALKRCTPTEHRAVGAVLKAAADAEVGRAEAAGQPPPGADEVDVGPAVDLVRRYRGVEDTVRRAEEHVERAAAAVAPFPPSSAKEALLAAADFAVARAS
jgi:octaprenyl-diphosphate synthase